MPTRLYLTILTLLLCLLGAAATHAQTQGQTWLQLNEQAVALYNQGKYREAAVIGENALLQAQKEFGKLHPSYATTLGNLALLYQAMGQYEKALPLHLEASTVIAQAQGKLHPSYASTLGNLALLYQAMGQYEKALPLLLEARQQYKTQLLQNVAILNENALTPFQITFDYQDFTYSLGYTARAPALLGQHYNDALLTRAWGCWPGNNSASSSVSPLILPPSAWRPNCRTPNSKSTANLASRSPNSAGWIRSNARPMPSNKP